MSTKQAKGKAVAAPVALKKALNRAWWDRRNAGIGWIS